MIDVSDAAVKAIKDLRIEKQDPNLSLRVGVKGGGCSGLTYTMDLTPTPMENDKVLEKDGVKVFVDLKSLKFLDGMLLDFFDNKTNKGFLFKNPNATATCGCGTSFSVS